MQNKNQPDSRLRELIGAVEANIRLHNFALSFHFRVPLIASQEMRHMMTSSFQCSLGTTRMHRGMAKLLKSSRYPHHRRCRYFSAEYFREHISK